MPFGRLAVIVFFTCLCLLVPLASMAQEAVFIIRHTEQAVDGEDPPLTDIGHQRAARLPSVFRDAGIRVIYTSETLRTIQTAQPLAKVLAIDSRIVPRREIEALVRRLAVEHTQDRVLIVSHSQTIPVLLRALGHTAEVPIGRDEYSSVFLVFPRQGMPPVVVRFHF
jgi:broad specificity phosphatase PhoE